MIKTENEMKWYAIRTQNNKEKIVLEKLGLEINRSKMSSLVGRTIIPVEKVMSSKNGKKFFRERTIYPGYIFIETSALGEVSNILKSVQGATGFVRTKSGDIHPIKDDEVKNLLKVEDEKREVVEKLTTFHINDEITITDGPFDTFKGKIQEILEEKQKVKVGVLVFGRITNIELNYDQVERVY
jgi:transcriptional antiterminator NusG